MYSKQELKGIDLFEKYFLQIIDDFDDVSIIIGGDLNARVGLLSDVLYSDNTGEFVPSQNLFSHLFDNVSLSDRSSCDTGVNSFGRQLIQFCKIHGLCTLNGRKEGDTLGKITCIANRGKSVNDYFVVSKNLYHETIDRFEVIPQSNSDHFPICLTLKQSSRSMSNNEHPRYETDHCDLLPLNKLKWFESEKESYLRSFSEKLNENTESFSALCEENNINEAVDLLNTCVKTSVTQQSTNKQKTNSQTVWFDKECEEGKRSKYRALNDFHRTNTTVDLDIYLNARREFKSLCKVKKKQYFKKQTEMLIENSLKTNSKDFWRQIKAHTNSKSPKITRIASREWRDYFKTLLNPGQNNDRQSAEENATEIPSEPSETTILNEPIVKSEIITAINKLKSGKASGPDGIAPEFYMSQLPIYIDYLHSLFNTIFSNGIYPEEWTKSAIFPLYKKGDPNNVNNYRGISLLNILGKIFSHILNARLKHWCDINQLIPEAQAGFRSSYSTIDNIFILQSLVQKYISRPGGRFYVFYVDFFKAFDWIDRNKLWLILSKYGCQGNMMNVLMSMYKSVLASVRVTESQNDGGVNNDLSHSLFITDYFECLSGVKQGCVLSPILFSIFISEFEKELAQGPLPGVEILTNDMHAHSLLYADDLVLFGDSVFEIQKKINALEHFCNKWHLRVNVDKSKMMVFRNGGYLKRTEKWWFNNDRLAVNTYYSYLGLVFSSRLCWSKCVDNHAHKALRVISFIRQMFKNFNFIDLSTASKIFDVKIKPMLLYGAEIWGTKRHACIEYAQIKFYKNFLGIGKTTENCFILKEVGRYPLWIETHIRAVKYWCKLLYLEEYRYPKKCYIQQLRHAESGRNNWASELRSIIMNTGFAFVWHAQQVGDVKTFLAEFKNRLISIGYQEMDATICSSYSYYLEYHPYNEAAYYTQFITSLSRRRTLALVRTRSLPIANNLARIKIYNDNKCQRCDMDTIDDEIHFFFICPSLSTLRTKYFPSILCPNDVIYTKLVKLLSSRNGNVMMNIYLFVSEALLNLRS